MKKLVLALGALAVAAGGTVGLLAIRKPAQAAAPNLVIDRTPERLARGRYLFEVAMDCGGCHSERDWSKFGAPEVTGRKAVGVTFPPEMGLPGQIHSANITSDPDTGIGAWTDGEVLRAIREGVSRDGRALFPMMPYDLYRSLSDADAYALVAYVRTLPAVRNPLPPNQINFPVNLLIKSAPRPVDGPVPAPNRANRVDYGRYLTTIGGCVDCHTMKKNGQPVAGMEFAGGMEFRLNGLSVKTANLTPELDTGLGAWTEERFIAKFRGYAHFRDGNAPPANQSNFTIMPWLGFSQLEEEDLKAIFSFLRTVPAVRHEVDPHKPSTQS
jgi:hypothetical protein